ncbi:MAG: VWA domain-containing protein [Gammaproteobacteria bacterium]|nr:VWA domain-containing protein [Gammaproteobacteria bacterium]
MILRHNFSATPRFTFSLSLLVGLLCGASALQADDVEVYLTVPSNPPAPNVMFVVDESGSMSGPKRNDLVAAMKAFINDPKMSAINMAIRGYSSTTSRKISDFKIVGDKQADLIADTDTIGAGGQTPTVTALSDAMAVFEGADSPIGNVAKNNWCRSNHIVLLSDGSPNNNHTTQYKGGTCANDILSMFGGGRCSREITAWGAGVDFRTGGAWDTLDENGVVTVQNVKSHTIGFGINEGSDTANYLEDVGTAGGGSGGYLANNAAALAAVFEEIGEGAQSSISYSYNAPAIPFSSDNAAVSGKYLYVPMFTPGAKIFWKGNLKKFSYSINNGDISVTAETGGTAIDTNGEFSSVYDYWNGSNTPDGGVPTEGGAASNMDGTRKLYTYLSGNNKDLTLAVNRVTDSNAGITKLMLGVADDATRTEVLDWVSWQDAGNLHEGEMGAPLHTSPIVVAYPGNDVVFLPTTEGVLEAIDAETGEELWAFMPEELLGGINTIKENNDSPKPYYGLDGPITIYKDAGKKYAIFGMRRGGKNYYLLDITAREIPKFVKTISKASLSTELGQTWSKPLFMKMYVNGITRDVLVFGGGYDEDQDGENSRVNDSEGRAIFIVDPTTGGLIKKIGSSYASEMKNGIAGDVLPVDINANGVIDRLYAADVSGRIIRVDIPDKDMDGGNGSITAGIIADVNGGGTGGYQRFFNTPAVGYFNRGGVQYLAILIGSGNRAFPSSKTTTDRFYMMKDFDVWSAPASGSYTKVNGWEGANSTPADGDLYDATANWESNATATSAMQYTRGWFINFTAPEKSFSKAVLYDYTVLFTTYSSEAGTENTDRCLASSSLGESYGYAIDMTDGSATHASMSGDKMVLEPGDRKIALGVQGIPSSPMLLFPSDGTKAGDLGSKVYGKFDLSTDGLEWDDRFHAVSWEEVIQ